MTVNQITELLIEKLKGEIDYFQKEALAASSVGDMKKCGELLSKQGIAIENALKLVETYNAKNSI